MTETALTKKQAILEMIQRMPENLSEDDVMYALYVRKAVERGIADAVSQQMKRSKESWANGTSPLDSN
jgi:hypothetical protein